VIDLVRALGGAGISVVVVTHVEEHAARLGGERWVCRAGRVEPKVRSTEREEASA
jgi:hypothetical protein